MEKAGFKSQVIVNQIKAALVLLRQELDAPAQSEFDDVLKRDFLSFNKSIILDTYKFNINSDNGSNDSSNNEVL